MEKPVGLAGGRRGTLRQPATLAAWVLKGLRNGLNFAPHDRRAGHRRDEGDASDRGPGDWDQRPILPYVAGRGVRAATEARIDARAELQERMYKDCGVPDGLRRSWLALPVKSRA